MTDNYDALRNAASPEQFCATLEAIACELVQGAQNLDCDWQDNHAGDPWRTLAKSLDIVAATYAVKPVRAPSK